MSDHCRLTFARLCTLVSCVCVAAAFTASPAPAQDDTAQTVPTAIAWYHSLDQAQVEARKSRRDVAVVFYTNWCRWCDSLSATTLIDPGLLGLQSRIVFARVNAESDTAAAAKFAVRRYPTIVILTKDGLETDRVIGYESPEEFVQSIDDALAGRGTLAALEDLQKKNSREQKYAVMVAQKKMDRGLFEETRDLLQRVLQHEARDPTAASEDALRLSALLARETGNWYRAAEAFRRLLKEFPKTAYKQEAELYIPWLYVQAGDTTSALRHYAAYLDSYGESGDGEWVKEQLSRLKPPDGAPSSSSTD